MNKMNQIPQVNTKPEIKLVPTVDLPHPTYNTIPNHKPLNSADLLDITVTNADGKLLEYSQHSIGIRCVITHNFSMLNGGKLQLKILDPNTNAECLINVTGETKNKIISMITNNYLAFTPNYV